MTVDINIIAIILSLVALAVTVVGFFASLKFYRDGMDLQSGANDALVKISEKADSIHSQVGGMFDKTLDALIGRSDLKRNFEGIDEQLKSTADAIRQISTAGEDERNRLASVVNEQMGLIRERVQETRESVEQFAELKLPNQAVSYLANEILAVLSSSKHPLSIQEIAQSVGASKTLILRVLNILSDENRIRVRHEDKTKIPVFSSISPMAPKPKT